MDPVFFSLFLSFIVSSIFTWEPQKLSFAYMFSLLIYNRYLFFGVFYDFVVCCILSRG